VIYEALFPFISFLCVLLDNRRIYKIFMRKEMTVVRLTDLSLMTRLSLGLGFEIVSTRTYGTLPLTY
jgi:hypothetical protein